MPKGKPSDTDIERVKFALAGGYWIKGRDISISDTESRIATSGRLPRKPAT